MAFNSNDGAAGESGKKPKRSPLAGLFGLASRQQEELDLPAIDVAAGLDRALRRGRLHRSNDHVTHPRIAPVVTAEHADAQELACSRVVRHPQAGLLLNHLALSTISVTRRRKGHDE